MITLGLFLLVTYIISMIAVLQGVLLAILLLFLLRRRISKYKLTINFTKINYFNNITCGVLPFKKKTSHVMSYHVAGVALRW